MRMIEFLHKDSIGPVVSRDMVIPLGPEGFRLESGKILPELSLRYETYGTLNAKGNNVVWVCSPLTADAHVAGFYTPEDKKAGWWDALIGPGKPVDTDRFFVVCSNILGGCQGSTGPSSKDPRTGKSYGSAFPNITIGDMVSAQKLLADALNIKRLYCVIGGSMGGFQAMKWAIYYPDYVDRCIVIASSPRFSSQALGFEIVGRDIIIQDPNFNGGDYYEGAIPAVGLANARKLAHITYLSAVGMEQKFKRAAVEEAHTKATAAFSTPFDMGLPLESYLRYQGTKFVSRFDANSYLHIAYATDTFDLETEYGSLETAFQNVQAEFLNVNLSTDWLFPPHESRKITNALLNTGKVVTSLELDTAFGHDGFLLEVGNLGKAVARFLNNKVQAEPHNSQVVPIFQNNKDLQLLESLIPEKSRILDLGCGGGLLIDTLWKSKKVTGVGVEKNFNSILDCIERDVPVIQKNYLEESELTSFADNSFDYAVFNRTFQEVKNQVQLLREILRIAKRAVITFPNFGHWTVCTALCFQGRMPKSKDLPYEWYNTPNIHLFTYSDFIHLCKEENLHIEKLVAVNDKLSSKVLTALGIKNLGAERVVAIVSR